MKILTILLLSLSLAGCATGYERKVDAGCSFLYFLPFPVVNLMLGNLACVVAADRAAVADAEDDEEEDDDDSE